MKVSQLSLIFIAVFTCAQCAFANGNGPGQEGNGQQGANQAGQCIAITSTLAPTEAEKTSLNFMREEEKLAHDVYRVFAEQWQVPIFSNIADSEASHFTQVQCLLDAYQLPNPASEHAGVFNNAELQTLYDTLIARGSSSLTEALMVGALIEEVDIADLTDALTQVNVPEIQTVYENLRRGSENHLRAFVRQLNQQGVTAYQAQALSETDLAAILAGQTLPNANAAAVATFDVETLILTVPELQIQLPDAISQAYRVILQFNLVEARFTLHELTPIAATHAGAVFDFNTAMLTIPMLQVTPVSALFPSAARYRVQLALTADGLAFQMVDITQIAQ